METNNMAAVNAKRFRKIAKMLRRLVDHIRKEESLPEQLAKESFDQVDDLAKEALIAKPRNCDVGTAEEQAERYGRYCDKFTGDGMHCETCPCCGKIPFGKCEFAWAQMPYDSEDENDKK